MKGAAKTKLRIKEGDMVVAITGADAMAGKSGKVLRVFPKQQRAVVEGFNKVKKTLRKSQDNPQGGIIDKEAPLHISNLRLAGQGEDKGSARKTAQKKRTKTVSKGGEE